MGISVSVELKSLTVNQRFLPALREEKRVAS